MATQTENLSSKQEAQLFVSGLKQHLAIDVKIQQPHNLNIAIHLARLYEKRAGVLNNQQQHNNYPPHPSPFVKRLNKAEMERRRAKGLCFNCDEPYTQGHRCKRLFWLELIEEQAGESDASEGTTEKSF